MKVFAINGSSNAEKGITYSVLKPFLEGIKESGVETELLYARRLNIKPCQTEFSCWFKTPGKCIIKDEMETALSIMKESEIWIFGIPVYTYISGEIQVFLNRMMPLFGASFKIKHNCMIPVIREDVKLKKIVLVSTCGFWGLENFDVLVYMINGLCKKIDVEFGGAVLRPHSGIYQDMLEKDNSVSDILDAIRRAGFELIKNGIIRTETLGIIGRPLISENEFLSIYNRAVGVRD